VRPPLRGHMARHMATRHSAGHPILASSRFLVAYSPAIWPRAVHVTTPAYFIQRLWGTVISCRAPGSIVIKPRAQNSRSRFNGSVVGAESYGNCYVGWRGGLGLSPGPISRRLNFHSIINTICSDSHNKHHRRSSG
jgi:hypothetical protein